MSIDEPPRPDDDADLRLEELAERRDARLVLLLQTDRREQVGVGDERPEVRRAPFLAAVRTMPVLHELAEVVAVGVGAADPGAVVGEPVRAAEELEYSAD